MTKSTLHSPPGVLTGCTKKTSSRNIKQREVTFGKSTESFDSYQYGYSHDYDGFNQSSDLEKSFLSPSLTLESTHSDSSIGKSRPKRLNKIFANTYGLKCASGNEERECFCYGDRKAGHGEVRRE